LPNSANFDVTFSQYCYYFLAGRYNNSIVYSCMAISSMEINKRNQSRKIRYAFALLLQDKTNSNSLYGIHSIKMTH